MDCTVLVHPPPPPHGFLAITNISDKCSPSLVMLSVMLNVFPLPSLSIISCLDVHLRRVFV
jgi:hypothetical protein